MPRVIEKFGDEVQKRLQQKDWSQRQATIATGIDHGTIGYMVRGIVPKKGIIIDWAVKIGESVNYWLKLAGYEPLEVRAVTGEVRGEEAISALLRSSWPQLPEDAVREIAARISEEEAKHETT